LSLSSFCISNLLNRRINFCTYHQVRVAEAYFYVNQGYSVLRPY
jgi:hypothetical protein